ncbi:MAG: ABC transporter ATP-binding protein [Alphaproteobacteria bacterium]|nr:ABC transporter ATP-binding protein [Alphaproteobacteria bacterium]
MVNNQNIAVDCQNITKIYGKDGNEVYALRGASLNVKKGELLMLAGPSGCGKTTLISIIASILDHDDGKCVVLGQDLQKMSKSDKINFRAENIGFVFQAFNLIPPLTSAENIAVPLIIQGVKREIATQKASALLIEMGMGEKKDVLPAALSGGQQQRVAIARALIHDPKLIVCDEPTSTLDSQTGQKIMKIMKKITQEQERTLIVVTHDIRIYHFADRIALMEDGKIKHIYDSYEQALAYQTSQEEAHV